MRSISPPAATLTTGQPQVFADAALDSEFHERGYVISPLLDATEVDHLKSWCHTCAGASPTGFSTTNFSADPAFRKRFSEGIEKIIGPRLRNLLPGYTPHFSSLLAKSGGQEKGKVPLHLDWTMVDLKSHPAINVWCPLLDVNEQNGCLHAVVGSHRVLDYIWPINGSAPPYHGLRETLERDYLTRFPMKAGSVILFDSRLLHGSHENYSEETRLVVGSVLLPNGVPPRLYQRDPERPDKLQVFEVTDEHSIPLQASLRFSKHLPVGVRHLEEIDYHMEPLRIDSFECLKPFLEQASGASAAVAKQRVEKTHWWHRLSERLTGSKST